MFTYEYFRFTVVTDEVHTSGIKQWRHLDKSALVLAGKVAMCFERLSKHHIVVNTPDTHAFVDLVVVLKCLLMRMIDNSTGESDTVVTVCRNIRQRCGDVAFIGLMNAYVVKLLNDDEFDKIKCKQVLGIARIWLRDQSNNSRCAIQSEARVLETNSKSSYHLLSFLLARYTNEVTLRAHIETQCVHLCTRVLNRTYVTQPSGPVFYVRETLEHTTICARAIQDALQDYSVVHLHMWGWLRRTRNIEWFNLESIPTHSKHDNYSTHGHGAPSVPKCHSFLASNVFWLNSLPASDNESVYKSAMTGQAESASKPAIELLRQLVGCTVGANPVARNEMEFKSDWKRICDGERLSGVGNPTINRCNTQSRPSDIVTALSPEWRTSCANVHASTLFLLGLNLLRVAVASISKFDSTQTGHSDSTLSHSLLKTCFQHAYEATLCMCAVQHTQLYTSDVPLHGIIDARGVVSQLAYVCVLLIQEVMYKMQTLQVPFDFTRSVYTENVFRVAKLDAMHGLPVYLLRRFEDTLTLQQPVNISAYSCLRPSSEG
jgi:hypothetical protein